MRIHSGIQPVLCLMFNALDEIVAGKVLHYMHERMIGNGERKVGVELQPFVPPLHLSGSQPRSDPVNAWYLVKFRQCEWVSEANLVSTAIQER